ncbi:hypothetical protein QBC36DRAFT_307614 [Triangularia setosa]|uniref:Uncharacterized protein n=1 Tax=Triangularia setosa TaxID=2587417 RepID=A0AAN7AC03_9PEZI|nr:hypothetical protein QBC36DRAFT_307614 [Podospora setosa]
MQPHKRIKNSTEKADAPTPTRNLQASDRQRVSQGRSDRQNHASTEELKGVLGKDGSIIIISPSMLITSHSLCEEMPPRHLGDLALARTHELTAPLLQGLSQLEGGGVQKRTHDHISMRTPQYALWFDRTFQLALASHMISKWLYGCEVKSRKEGELKKNGGVDMLGDALAFDLRQARPVYLGWARTVTTEPAHYCDMQMRNYTTWSFCDLSCPISAIIIHRHHPLPPSIATFHCVAPTLKSRNQTTFLQFSNFHYFTLARSSTQTAYNITNLPPSPTTKSSFIQALYWAKSDFITILNHHHKDAPST